MSRSTKRVKIYASKIHLVVTLLFLSLPFIFFLIFVSFTHIETGKLLSDLLNSLVRITVAFIIAAALGWFLAVSFYKGKRAALALPIFDVLQSFPTFAALPLATYFLGASNKTVILFLVITIIWPIFFSIISSLKLIQKDWEEAVAVAGLSGRQYLRYFLWPVSTTGLITGSIIGLGEGWEALVATEIIVGVKDGLGNFFRSEAQNASVTVLGIFGLLFLIFSLNQLIWMPLLDWSHRKMEE